MPVTVSSDDITRARVGRPEADPDVRLRDGSPAALRSWHGDRSLAGGAEQQVTVRLTLGTLAGLALTLPATLDRAVAITLELSGADVPLE